MPKYLLQVSYTASGAQGVMKEGGSSRRDTVAKLLADAGGTLDEFYFTFGEDDVITIVDLPDHASVAALSVYDIIKAVDKHAVLTDIKVLAKSGGKSGDWTI